jgi:predicted nucleic acid-binding protein
VAHEASGLASCELARLEFVCTVRRHAREGHLTPLEARQVLADFRADEEGSVWRWLPVSSALVRRSSEEVVRLPSRAIVRALDVLHLATARDHGFREVYTNDRHMLVAAGYFGLTGVNLIE